ncbi:MAG: CHAT domain-containing protein [Cyanothece sp. SIO1E1]|nr:CHAT domain-containing protein [Cyanothece sp. SIO1E1]
MSDELHAIIRETDDPGIYPGRVFMNDRFDFNALRRNARNHRVLHIATHAKFEPGALEDSFLVLGNGDPLRISKIEQIGRQLRNVHLVVLSACETALGGQGADGREIAGLSAYFLAPNRAKSVLASLWQVADDSTSLLMQQFYAQLATGDLSKAEALQQVQSAFIQNDDEMASLLARGGGFESVNSVNEIAGLNHPYYWAPFILIGNGL